MEFQEYARMDAAEDAMWWYRALRARLLDAIAGQRGSLLDAGCGTGGFLARLRAARPDLHLTGLEFDPAAAARAAEKSGAAVVRGDIGHLPFAPSSFDIATSADVLSHAATDPATALPELRRVLRVGGLLVLNMPALPWLLSAHDRRVRNVRRPMAAELRGWLTEAGFATMRTRYWNGVLLPLMAAQRRVLRARHDSASDVAVFPPWLDRTLYAVTELERRVGFVPVGGSILVTAIRA